MNNKIEESTVTIRYSDELTNDSRWLNEIEERRKLVENELIQEQKEKIKEKGQEIRAQYEWKKAYEYYKRNYEKELFDKMYNTPINLKEELIDEV